MIDNIEIIKNLLNFENGCFISKQKHPLLHGNYVVFQNNPLQTHIGRTQTFKQAKQLCEKNECFDNFLKF
jgi:hypothetical protein